MEECNVLDAIKRRKAKRIGHILRTNCPGKHFIEGKIEGTRRRERWSKQLLDVIQGTEEHWKLKQEALVRYVWKTRFGSETTTTTTMMMMMMMMMIYYL